MQNIMEVARLIRVLESEDYTISEKAAQIRMVRDNGDISADDALELAIEYFNDGDYKHKPENKMKTVVGDLVGELQNSVDAIMAKYQDIEGIKYGDCDPFDSVCIDDLIDTLAEVLMRVLESEKPDWTLDN